MRNSSPEANPPTRTTQDVATLTQALDNPAWKVRCSRTKKSGERCKNWAARGSTVCPKHGGNVPATRAKAERRLEALKNRIVNQSAPSALTTIEALLGAEDERVRLKAAQDLLDRAGLAPTRTQHNVNENHNQHSVTHSLDQEISALLAAQGVTLPDGSPRPSHTTGPALPPSPLDDEPHDELQDNDDYEELEPLPPDPRHQPTQLLPLPDPVLPPDETPSDTEPTEPVTPELLARLHTPPF